MSSIEVGEKFGQLTVAKLTRRGNRKAAVCECTCGKETEVLLQSLVSGNTKSCGCLIVSKPTMRTKDAERYQKMIPGLMKLHNFNTVEELNAWVDSLCKNT